MTNADNFKSGDIKLTESRIRQIVRYIIHCYLKILADKKTYNYSERGRIPKEEFLRNGLVNDYLQKSSNKEYFKHHISDNPSVEINFHPEETMPYRDSEGVPGTDKIDIAVCENALQALWSKKTEDEIRFAIECKRIKKLSDASKYVSDSNNFCSRDYVYTRLPFEGQIAFIEDQSISHDMFAKKVNEILRKSKIIHTNNLLAQTTLCDEYDGTYLSGHRRRVSQQNFFIYHLFFDYSF